MIRTIIITLLNIALPFLIRAIYLYILRLNAQKKQKDGIKDITPPEWSFPVKKLIIIGLMISIIFIAIVRFTSVEIDTPYKGNIIPPETIK